LDKIPSLVGREREGMVTRPQTLSRPADIIAGYRGALEVVRLD